MGSAGSKSKATSSSSSSSSSGRRRVRSKAHKVLQSSCLGTTTTSRSHSHHHLIQNQNQHQLLVSDNRNNKENASNAPSPDEMPKIECYNSNNNNNNNNSNNRKVKIGQHSDEMPSNISHAASTIGTSAARAPSPQSLNPSGRILSRFSFIPGNISSRLSRANSLGSSRSYPTLFNNEDDVTGGPPVTGGFIGEDESHQGNELRPMSMTNPTPALCCEDSSANLQLNTAQSNVSNCLGDDRASSYVARNGTSGSGIDGNFCSQRNLTEMENVGSRVPDRNAGAREPIERNVRFSRTLSVGRLRDRVLRRSSLSDITFSPIQQQIGEVRATDQVSVGQAWEDQTRILASESSAVGSPNSSAYPSSSLPNSLFSIQDYEVETSRSRETRYHDLLEHRSNFLERRRRIRSQVRALQRLGSRFENLSGHERTCILSGQHRTGRCTCRISNRDLHLNDDTSARASISRIVLLAEALFEVLDEIHQQSVVLSSRPSVSSIGSVPAPSDVVESLPVKLYAKLQKHQNEEVTQCYICLVEYEEGERMRILPCHHEFHKTCVDKWLKEIHRVCPLCRGDVCRSDSLPSED